MTNKLPCLMLALIIAAAANQASAGGYVVGEVHNPVYRPNTVFSAPENLAAPVFTSIRERYNLAQIISGEPDEFTRILLLRNWLHRHIVVDKSKPAAPADDALAILERGPDGGRYSCGHFEIAQNAVLGAMGYVTRCILSGPDGEDPELTGSHGSNEVWCNELCKWVLVDAELDSHFEKNGVPLSALEVRGAYLADGGAGVERVVGQERKPVPRGKYDQWGRTPKSYAFISWRWQTDRLSRRPEKGSSEEVVYDDEFFRTHTWYRSGRKNWAYAAGAFHHVRDRGAIEWTPNVLEVNTIIDGNTAEIRISSETPNLKEYQIMRAGGSWEPVKDNFQLQLSADREQWRLRSLNTAGVGGPEYRLLIEKR